MSKYQEKAKEVALLVEKKQEAYGDSFGKSGEVLKILYPNGIKVEQYQDMLTVVRILDKMFRIATDKDAFGESPYKDILGYSLLAVAKEVKKEAPEVKKECPCHSTQKTCQSCYDSGCNFCWPDE